VVGAGGLRGFGRRPRHEARRPLAHPLRRSDGSVLATSGVYRVVEPPRLLAFSWAWEDESGTRGHETEVVVNFEAAPGGTRLVLVQRRFASKQARDNHTNGWSACFDRLTGITG